VDVVLAFLIAVPKAHLRFSAFCLFSHFFPGGAMNAPAGPAIPMVALSPRVDITRRDLPLVVFLTLLVSVIGCAVPGILLGGLVGWALFGAFWPGAWMATAAFTLLLSAFMIPAAFRPIQDNIARMDPAAVPNIYKDRNG
jgi:hypothetical protein